MCQLVKPSALPVRTLSILKNSSVKCSYYDFCFRWKETEACGRQNHTTCEWKNMN